MSRNETEVPAPYERDHRRVAVAFAAVLKLARGLHRRISLMRPILIVPTRHCSSGRCGNRHWPY